MPPEQREKRYHGVAMRLWGQCAFVVFAAVFLGRIGACAPVLPVCLSDSECLSGQICCEGLGLCADGRDGCVGPGPCLAPGAVEEDRFMPLIPGSTWAYEVVKGGQITFELQRLGELESDGFPRCRESRSPEGEALSASIRWLARADEATVTAFERKFNSVGVETAEIGVPPQLALDESEDGLCEGSRFHLQRTDYVLTSDTCASLDFAQCDPVESERTDNWTVDSVEESVSVPAGEFPSSLMTTRERIRPEGDRDFVTFGYARGVGKVEERVVGDGRNESEQLVAFDIPGVGSGGAPPGPPMPPCDAAWRPTFP